MPLWILAGTALGTCGVAAVSAAVPSEAGDPEPVATTCPPIVLLEGDPAVTAPVAAALAADGISGTADGDCPAVDARIEERDGALLVIIQDAYGRSSERSVADAASAAALVESWARGDLVQPLLAARPSVVVPPTPTANVEPIVGVDLAAETAVAFDASVWLGAHLAGCVRLGPTCLGALARFAVDGGFTGDSADFGTRRLGLDVLLVADFPVDCGSVVVVPGAGFGAGWMRATATTTGTAGDDTIDVDGGGLRTDAHVTLTVPVGSDLAIDVGLGVDVWILAHTSSYAEEGVTLAGEPRGRVRATVGLRYGAP